MNSYVLKIDDIRQSEAIELSEAEYVELSDSERILRTSAQIEEKMDLLLENYLDYEKEILTLSLASLIRNSFGGDHLESARPNLNRKLVNVLTAAKLYVDQTKHELSSQYGKTSDMYVTWNQFRNESHASNSSYQFMEVLRNYVQHHSLPIDSVGFRGVYDKNENPPQSKRST